MGDSILTPERILEAAEEVLRRFGSSKATVVDVARVLGVSHGTVYRHFPSKAALRDAVTEQWLARMSAPLEVVMSEQAAASVRLRHWLDLLMTTKRQKALSEPELFGNYLELAAESREVVMAHVQHLVAQLSQIIADGIRDGEFVLSEPSKTARAVLDATTRFHNPAHVADWSNPDIDEAFEQVWSIILRGLKAA